MSVIKIPSGSIYEKSTNILPDNVIKRIDVPYTRIVPKQERNVSVYSTETRSFTKEDESNSTSLLTGRTLDYQNNYDFSGTYLQNGELLGYVYLKAKLTFCSGTFTIPKLHDNALITEIFAGITQDDSGKHNQISYTLDGNYSSQTIASSAIWTYDKTIGGNQYYYFDVNEPNVTGTSDETQSPYNLSGFPIDTNVQITVEKEYTDSGRTVKPSVTLNLDNDTRIGISVTETNNGYEITYKVLAGYEIDEMSGYNRSVDTSDLYVPISGFRREFVPTEISFNINGVRLALDITENVATIADFGNSSSNKMMLYEGNELISSAMGFGSSPIYNYYRSIYENYNNGKETATIKCALGNYYDFDTGELCIQTDGNDDIPSTFKFLDQVIPMRYAVQRRILPDGTTEFYRENVPLSTYASGNPKKFQVLGVQFDYSGIGYQTLYLQEIAEN